ncbi:MAG TPA: hypothetical protein VF116_01405 [Ktedonobacterales bacterium]
MNDKTVSLCALHLGDDMLSALRDVALRPPEAERVAAHVPGCVACQVRLSAFETLGALLRAQPAPDPRPSALIELNARILTRYPRRAAGGRSSIPHPGSWRGLLALIVALLLAALFARFLTAGLHFPAGHPTPHIAPHAASALIAKEFPWQAKTS